MRMWKDFQYVTREKNKKYIGREYSEEFLNSKMYDAALQDKNQFVKNG